jgi:pSer/pThr/pTyr-binding forkhead associated (FHA) protein
MRSWVIGSKPECDVVVDSPLASGRHCELTEENSRLSLRDLGSTNGTFLNGERIATGIVLQKGDVVTLGRTVPFPWPPELLTIRQIGRLADNDVVVDDVRVSGHHARLITVAGLHTLIEDLGSSNGTFLNSTDQRISVPTPISATDTLYFGSLLVSASALLKVPEPSPAATRGTPTHTQAATFESPTVAPAAPGAVWPESVTRAGWLIGWWIQAIALAFLIAALVGRPAVGATGEALGKYLARATFAVTQAAVWLGLSLALVQWLSWRTPASPGGPDKRPETGELFRRLAISSGNCLIATAVFLLIVRWGLGLVGGSLAMWALLALATLVGLMFGAVILERVRPLPVAGAILLAGFAAMTIFGGWLLPLPQMNPLAHIAASATPSRWAFEGVFLLETDHRSNDSAETETEPAQAGDLAEGFFRAASERMGPRADGIALLSMLVGLSALAAFGFTSSRGRPDTPSSA